MSRVPSILLEDDGLPPLPAKAPAGPAERFTPRAEGKAVAPAVAPAELPTAYGTGRLLLVARDPHWLYAHWDFTEPQLVDAVHRAGKGQLALRVFASDDAVVADESMSTSARNWFVRVPRGGTRYHAELGVRSGKTSWKCLARSGETLTPAEQSSTEDWVRFETLPASVSMETLREAVAEALPGNAPLLEAVARLRAEGSTDLPLPAELAVPDWPRESQEALARLLRIDEARQVWVGSIEITEMVRRQLLQGGALPAWPGVSGDAEAASRWSSSALAGPAGDAAWPTSPAGPATGEAGRGFWFNVNVELIVYGATDPAATVKFGERVIRLRPDGTFSYRFALPDGQYELPIEAISPDGVESRSADLGFGRTSRYRGEVAEHAQDERLNSPRPDHVG